MLGDIRYGGSIRGRFFQGHHFIDRRWIHDYGRRLLFRLFRIHRMGIARRLEIMYPKGRASRPRVGIVNFLISIRHSTCSLISAIVRPTPPLLSSHSHSSLILHTNLSALGTFLLNKSNAVSALSSIDSPSTSKYLFGLTILSSSRAGMI